MSMPTTCLVCHHITNGSFTYVCSSSQIAFGDLIRSIASPVSQMLICPCTIPQLDWAYHNNFVNAPFRLIPRILQLIQEQQADATLLVLWWPAQAWFQTLRKLSIDHHYGFKTGNTCSCDQLTPQNHYTITV